LPDPLAQIWWFSAFFFINGELWWQESQRRWRRELDFSLNKRPLFFL
jgi:hypothetical protein